MDQKSQASASLALSINVCGRPANGGQFRFGAVDEQVIALGCRVCDCRELLRSEQQDAPVRSQHSRQVHRPRRWVGDDGAMAGCGNLR